MLMNKLRPSLLLGAALAFPAGSAARGAGIQGNVPESSSYQRYIAERKERAEQSLARRLAGIEKRFSESSGMRAKQKDERVLFEKKMEREEEAFLDGLPRMSREDRGSAWDGFREKRAKERTAFYERLRQEGRAFWDSRRRKKDGGSKEGKTARRGRSSRLKASAAEAVGS